MSEKMLVGIVGLGKIGAAVASHVLAAGYAMLGWARRQESLEEFTRSGGRAVERIPALGAASIVISVVFDNDALSEVAFGPGGLVEAMQPGAMHIAMERFLPGSRVNWKRLMRLAPSDFFPLLYLAGLRLLLKENSR